MQMADCFTRIKRRSHYARVAPRNACAALIETGSIGAAFLMLYFSGTARRRAVVHTRPSIRALYFGHKLINILYNSVQVNSFKFIDQSHRL